MRTLNERHTSKGRPMATCHLCSNSLIGHVFFKQLTENKLSFIQKNQMKLMLKTARAGAQVLDMKMDESPKSLVSMILTRHYSSKALKRDKQHKQVLDEMIDTMNDMEVLKKYASFDAELLVYLES